MDAARFETTLIDEDRWEPSRIYAAIGLRFTGVGFSCVTPAPRFGKAVQRFAQQGRRSCYRTSQPLSTGTVMLVT
jgi:hypothetical protein